MQIDLVIDRTKGQQRGDNTGFLQKQIYYILVFGLQVIPVVQSTTKYITNGIYLAVTVMKGGLLYYFCSLQ